MLCFESQDRAHSSGTLWRGFLPFIFFLTGFPVKVLAAGVVVLLLCLVLRSQGEMVSPYFAAPLQRQPCGGWEQPAWFFPCPRGGDHSTPSSAGSSETGQGKCRLRVAAGSWCLPRDRGRGCVVDAPQPALFWVRSVLIFSPTLCRPWRFIDNKTSILFALVFNEQFVI